METVSLCLLPPIDPHTRRYALIQRILEKGRQFHIGPQYWLDTCHNIPVFWLLKINLPRAAKNLLETRNLELKASVHAVKWVVSELVEISGQIFLRWLDHQLSVF